MIDPPGSIVLSQPESRLSLNCSGAYKSKPTWFLINQRLEETIGTTITDVLDVVTHRHHVILTRDGADNTGIYQCIDEATIAKQAVDVVVTVKESGLKLTYKLVNTSWMITLSLFSKYSTSLVNLGVSTQTIAR